MHIIFNTVIDYLLIYIENFSNLCLNLRCFLASNCEKHRYIDLCTGLRIEALGWFSELSELDERFNF